MKYIIVSRQIPVVRDTLNNYHPKMKLIIETNSQIFLDTEITHINGTIETKIPRKITDTIDIKHP